MTLFLICSFNLMIITFKSLYSSIVSNKNNTYTNNTPFPKELNHLNYPQLFQQS